MSLSRILNNEPSSPIPAPPTLMSIDPALMAMSPPPGPTEQPPNPRGYTFQPVEYQGAGGWDPYTGEWVQGDIFPLGPGGNYYPDRMAQQIPTQDSLPHQSAPHYKDSYSEGLAGRKRRKVDDGDSDYVPPGQRRYAPRRHPPRTKHFLAHSPSEAPDVEPKIEEYRATDEELRLASSDLEDCEEIWLEELGNYVIETHKRAKAVEGWFQGSIVDRNGEAAHALSHRYAQRVASIPVPPPPHGRRHEPIDDGSQPTRYPITYPPDPGDTQSYDLDRGDFASSEINGDLYEDGEDAADAAQELEESVLGNSSTRFPGSKGKGKEASKRLASGNLTDASSDLEIPSISIKERKGPAAKKRRVDHGAGEVPDEVERSGAGAGLASVIMSSSGKKLPAKGKGKGKQSQESIMQMDSVASGPLKPARKKPGPKKKAETVVSKAQARLGVLSASASVTGDLTPTGSRACSPAPSTAIIFDFDEEIPPLKKAKKTDDASMLKRVLALEEAQRKVWLNIARKDVAKVYKYHAMGYQAKQAQLKRLATVTSLQARRPFQKTTKGTKDIQTKGKRLMREMLVFWKKNEREERDVRKREHREALDRAKEEDEKREAARQARKLEFLISQTELYSHFVGNKLKTAEVEGDSATGKAIVPTGGAGELDKHLLRDIDFDDEDQTNLHAHAARNAQDAIALAKQRALEFDSQAALDRKTNEALALVKGPIKDTNGGPSSSSALVDLDSDELNFQNPTSLTGPLKIEQPRMLMAQLKEYQLKGLNWLGTLYEQGINGILADEMGLGKTVQSISLLAYLAETHDIWGPFLVVAPASTLHNWQQELTRFVPKLKALPYWGNVKDRATLRKFWSKKEISYNQDAPFHVLITSYQLVTQDQQYFQRVRWQYMVLDEAQNIKNSSSVRWKTLLGFQCRNRLLLTGTPIQNSMQELWALLHFIMPSLFDSHDEFSEWFSKDIENAAENKGSKLNEHQLRRLHMILKPFMLRRVKRHVQNELSEKIEIDIYVDLSARQRALYRSLRANVSVTELLAKAANIGDADSARSLMNLVMQFRKVCNHPELFERADVVAPFSFSSFGQSGPLTREGDFIPLYYSTRNPIQYIIPQLFYLDGGILSVPNEFSPTSAERGVMKSLFNIWSTDWVRRSVDENAQSPFCFLPLLDMSPSDAHTLHASPLIRRQLWAVEEDRKRLERDCYLTEPAFIAHAITNPYRVPPRPLLAHTVVAEGLPHLSDVSQVAWSRSCLSRPGLTWFVPPVVAPTMTMYCADRTFLESQCQLLEGPLESLALYGLPPVLRESADASTHLETILPGLPPCGLIHNSPLDQLPRSTMQVPEAKRLIYDSAKLARLDTLLHELKAGDHRVLIYFQMTRMMDLMEEYLIYRQYKYLRLDGSSKLEDRRDMVIDWQTRPDIFVFLLSTRAGGLGINLTAADTVVFYDHDWNPSNDAQAMDRAHRLGQTRQVTVYRLITRGTIDERIIQLARVKKDVQDIVVGNKQFTDVTKPSEIVSLLLNEDELAGLTSGTNAPVDDLGAVPMSSAVAPGEAARDLWNEEGDDFFGHSGQSAPNITPEPGAEDEEVPTAPPATRGKKRNRGGGPRGRKASAKNSTRNVQVTSSVNDI